MLAELRRCYRRNAKQKRVRSQVEEHGRYPDGEIWYDTRIASCYQSVKNEV
jgi:hypothetical protein